MFTDEPAGTIAITSCKNAPINFAMCLPIGLLSACNSSRITERIIVKFDIQGFLPQYLDIFKFRLKSNENSGHITWRPARVPVHTSRAIREMFQLIAVDKYEIRVLGPIFFPQLFKMFD
jgi:hypothetical protein